MAQFEIQTPSGRTLTIEAADQDTAIRGAQQWESENAPQPAVPARAAPPPDQQAPTQVGGQPVADAQGTIGGSLLEGVPIIGPAIMSGVDRAVAGARSIGLGGEKAKSYAEELKHVQDWRKASNEAHPVAHTAGNVAGGVLAGVAAAPVVGAMAPASRLLQLGGGVIGGAGVGAADSAIRAEDGHRGEAALTGGVLGAVGGALAPAIAAGVGRAVNYGGNLLTRATALRGTGVSPQVAAALSRTISEPEAAANIAAAGPRAMLADAGESASGLLDSAIARGGQGAQAARQAVTGRAAGAGDDIQAAMDRALGPAESPTLATSAERAAGRPVNKANYDDAYSKPIDYAGEHGQALEQSLERVPASAIKRANAIMALRGERSAQIHLNENPDGSFTLSNPPDVRQWDYITRALNEEAQHGAGAGAMGGQTLLGSSMNDLSREIRTSLRKAVPEFGKAVDTAKDSIDIVNARAFGQKMLSPTVEHGVVHQTVKDMTDAELQAVRQGVRGQFDEALANMKAVASNPNTDAREAANAYQRLSSRAVRDKIATILPREEATRLFDAVDQAGKSLGIQNAIATNSRTMGRLAGKEIVENITAPGVVGTLAKGEGFNAGKRVIQALTGATPENLVARQDEVYAEIAKALTEKRGSDALKLMGQLRNAQAMMQRTGAAAQLLGQRAGGAAAGITYQAPRQLIGMQ